MTISNSPDEILRGKHQDGQIDRTVGDSLFYVAFKDGTSLGFKPKDVLVKSREGIKPFRGQSLRELGVVNGARVQVFGVDDPQVPDRVVVDQDRFPTFLQWLRRSR